MSTTLSLSTLFGTRHAGRLGSNDQVISLVLFLQGRKRIVQNIYLDTMLDLLGGYIRTPVPEFTNNQGKKSSIPPQFLTGREAAFEA